MQKKDYIILAIIIVIAFAARLYKLNTPLADLHSWRQVDTAAVARNFSRDGIDLMRPTYDDLSSIQTGYENPEGLRYVEFPIYNAMIAVFHRYLPITSITVYGRLISSFFSLIIIAIIYYFALKEKNRISAIGAAGMYAVFPYFVFFSRVVLPETTAVAFMMLSLFFLYHAVQKKGRAIVLFSLGGIFFALSILTKPTTIFYGLTAAYLFIMTYKFDVFKTWKPYYFFLLALTPFVLWRMFITQFPQGIPGSSWLFTTVNTFEGPREIFFRPAFFRWMFMDRIGIAMLGIYSSAFFVLGILGKYKQLFAHTIFISGMIYLFTFQGGNVQHEYYQTIFFPAVALMTGMGIAQLVELPKKLFHRWLLYPTIIVVFALSCLMAFYKVKDYYVYPQDLPRIAELIKIFTKPEDRIVTDRLGDTTLLYLADRKGAPAVYHELPKLKELGYSYLVTTNKEQADIYKEQQYEVIVENELFTMIRL